MDLHRARVLLTGSTGGLGRTIAERLAAAGAELVVSGRREADLQALAAPLGAEVLVADLARPGAVEAMVRAAGRVDVLVANAGLPGSGDLLEFTEAEVDAAIDVNLRTPIQLTRALLPAMIERRSGQVVLMSSLAGVAASPQASLYNATKFGLRGFGLALRQDLSGSGVGVSVVLPGFVRDAGMFADSGATLPRGVGTCTPDQVAEAVLACIRDDKAEVAVGPLGLRVGAYASGLVPGLAAAVQRRLGGHQVARDIAGGQHRP